MNTVNIRLLHVFCSLTDETDGDELYLKRDKKKIWPVDSKFLKIKPNQRVSLGIELTEIPQNEMTTIELWDFDYLSRNDLLGTFNIQPEDVWKGNTYQTDMRKKDLEEMANYTLTWEVF